MGAVITGWGKGIPLAVLTNDGLAEFLDTSDAWITTRTGIRERRVAHVGVTELAEVAARHALAAAGVAADEFDCILLATASPDLLVPNSASRVQLRLGNRSAAAADINVGCCGFLYALAAANGLLATGVHQRVLVIGAERLTPILDWTKRDSAILFGDGAGAVVVEAGAPEEGVQGAYLACDPEPGAALMAADLGGVHPPARKERPYDLRFDGREVFRNAVPGMVQASRMALQRAGITLDDVDLLVPHQANLRIVEAVGKQLPIDPAQVFTNLQRYGNTSAASIPLALSEALEAGQVRPGARLLFTAFGAGLTRAAIALRWGARVQPVGVCDAAVTPCAQSAVELLRPTLEFQQRWWAEHAPD